MALRPVALSIPSTTQLKITFSIELSETLSADNFRVESLSGAVDDLEIVEVTISGKVAKVKTRPQKSGNYYLLKFLDTRETQFISTRGLRLLDDATSRELFFVGIDTVNPIRDRMLDLFPNIFEVSNTNTANIISAQAEEIFKAQKSVGEILSNNYICEEVIDEPRTRTAGATDRLANENAYDIFRVSQRQTGDRPTAATINYTSDNPLPRSHTMSVFPTSLQQTEVIDETINISTAGNGFEGYLLTLTKSNVIKVLSVKLIRDGEIVDCDGNIGLDYNIERFKYSIKNNFYDQNFAFEFSELSSNQVLLSEFGNLSRPALLDTILITYLYKDTGKFILEDSVSVSRVESKVNESLPTNSTRFFLGNAPIVNIDNKIVTIGGVSFKVNENTDQRPPEFSKELVFDASKLPSKLGEYSIDYRTGEVFLVGGDDLGEGTGRNNFVATYFYRREFSRDLDYSIYDQNIVPTPDRGLANKEAEIFINFDRVFVEGIDYKASSHIEVLPEFIENRLSSSFSIETLNQPITNVYRILNQTTGEIYNPLFNSDTEIQFSGVRSPEIKNSGVEESTFSRSSDEELRVIGEFVVPSFRTRITSNASRNSIIFSPGIPAEFVSQNSDNYFFRETDATGTEVMVEDILIRFFGIPDSNNLITTAGISLTSPLPSVNSEVFIGTQAYVVHLDQIGILNRNEDSIGSLLNTSLEFSDQSIFQNEKYFEPIVVNPGLSPTSNGGISSAFTTDKGEVFTDNISKMRKVGDYTVDYKNGIVYIAIDRRQGVEIGRSSYSYNRHRSRNKNILNAISISRKKNSPDPLNEAIIVYNTVTHDNTTMAALDLENTLTVFDNETTALDLNSNRELICRVRDDYTVLVPFEIITINSIVRLADLTGIDLTSSSEANRSEEKTVDEMITNVRNGGRNLYDNISVTFEKNVIDFKKKAKRRVLPNTDGDYTVTILDSNASTFLEAVQVTTDLTLFDDMLNITKLGSLSLSSVTGGVGTATVSVVSGTSLLAVDTTGDFLLDVNGDRFTITAIDSVASTITVATPAVNNITATEPATDLTGSTKVVVKPTVVISDGTMVITIPSDAPISSGEMIEITYLTTLIPSIGTPLSIDYRYGFIFNEYSYVHDEIVVWYEYGDNELDWSINNTLEEGEEYLVSYNYGASREALRTNFGNLTNIPFFRTFPLTIDRELYRDALKGTLQAFSKGPTIPAYEELVESFTKINPNIDELIFGNWILGRDHLCPGKINYEGILNFGQGKFEEGLIYNSDVVTDISAISGISLNEGTLEAWVRPDWSGINNDATLTFELDNIGDQQIIVREADNPFSKEFDWGMIPSTALVGGTDTMGSGINIFNYRSDAAEAGGLSTGVFGLYKKLDNLNRTIDTDFTSRIRIGLIGNNFNDLRKIITSAPDIIDLCESETAPEAFFTIGCHGPGSFVEGPWPAILGGPQQSFNVGSFLVPDGDRSSGVLLNLNEIPSFKFETGTEDILSIEGEEVPKYNRPHLTRSCKCSINNRIDILERFNELTVEISLGSDFDLSNFKSGNSILDDSPSVFMIVDTEGVFYPVVGFIDELGDFIENSIPDTVETIIVKRFGINNTALSGMGSEAINSVLPSGILRMFYKSADIITKNNYSKSEQAFEFIKSHVLDWGNYHDYRVIRTPNDNLVDIYIDSNSYRMFYTDTFYSCNLDFSISISSDDLRGILIGILNNRIISNLEMQRFNGLLTNRFDLSDIRIGREGYSPRKIPFNINRDDFPDVTVGMPPGADIDEGIFIWFDELCLSPLSSDIGQWIFRAKANRTIECPIDVVVSGTDYTNITSPFVVDHKFPGRVFTDGEFSSVERSSREETLGGCAIGEVCNVSFRYCGNDLLEDFGWAKLDETSSDLINTIVGGTETQRGAWRKHGLFTTSASRGIYRMGPTENNFDCVDEANFLGNLVYTENPCSGGDSEYLISMRVSQVDPNVSPGTTGGFSGAVSGNLTGIVPLNLNDGIINIKVALGFSTLGESLILIMDGESNAILDIISYIWNDQQFHEYRIEKDQETSRTEVFVDNLLVSQLAFSEFITPIFGSSSEFERPNLSIYLLDTAIVDPTVYLTENQANIIDVDLVFFAGIEFEGDGYLEANDILINTDSRIEFCFNIDSFDDGYLGLTEVGYDGYDGYLDVVGVDEMFISSDRLRYLVDTGVDEADRRLSVFKDGKGFLNFRIFDDTLSRGGEVGMFNLATNIKNFRPGELHHIAASWRLNSVDEKDEMHLFVDGQEAPNIYKFGGKVPVKLSDKFSDVSKETLLSFLVNDLEFCDTFVDGTVSAGGSIFQSATAGFTQSMIGRSLIITGSTLAPTMIGQEFIILSVVDSLQVTLGRGDSLEALTFQVSAGDIEFAFPPTAGIKASVLTDLRNSRFSIYRENSAGNVQEFGGVLYTVDNGIINILNGSNIIKPKFRANIDTRIIEFVGEDINCNFVATVVPTDIDVHIETLGLNLERCKEKLQLSSSSYVTGPNLFSGSSVVKTRGIEPVSLDDVDITRIVLDKQIIDIVDPIPLLGGGYQVDFNIGLPNTEMFNSLTSESGSINKQNLGRLITLFFDSDNVDFCDFDGYEDGYQDGYLDGALNTITIYGTTIDGINEETFFIEKNGEYHSTKFFTTVTSIEGSLSIIDPDYFELGIISLRETNTITTSNNNGERAEILDYKSGHFVLTVDGSIGTFPFELHPGFYLLDYPGYLTVNLPMVGDRMYIGSDFNKSNQFGGVIDEFRVISEKSSDTRVTEFDTSGTRSVTSDFNRTVPACPDNQTLALLPLNNPINLQSRRLRTTEFLDEDNNIKFNLTRTQQEDLLLLANNSTEFISKMVNIGFSIDDSTRTFYEVHRAEGGPLFNDADFYRNAVDFPQSDRSVNESFKSSGNFISGPGIIIKNDAGQFRKNEGSIEFWVSPAIDTVVDPEKRTYVDIFSIKRERLMSKTSTVIELPNAASEIIDIKLIRNTQEFSKLFSEDEVDDILFNEVFRSEITGRLDGGTGTDKDFGLGSKLSADGRRVLLAEPLPAVNTDIIVTYVPRDSQGDRFTVFKNEHNQLVFAIRAGQIDNVVTIDIDWKKNTWHRVLCAYRTGTDFDTMRIFADGSEGGFIRYGTGIIYGTGFVYGQFAQSEGQLRSQEFSIELKDEFKLIAVGSDIFGDNNARSRMDNIRFSRIIRNTVRDFSGAFIDIDYSENLNTVLPVIDDDATTLLIDFDEDKSKIDKFATVIDPERGIYNFDVEVIDNFDRVIGISDGLVEDLIVDLVDRLKPAHSNALVKFTKSKC
jgi:hypothetical protein